MVRDAKAARTECESFVATKTVLGADIFITSTIGAVVEMTSSTRSRDLGAAIAPRGGFAVSVSTGRGAGIAAARRSSAGDVHESEWTRMYGGSVRADGA